MSDSTMECAVKRMIWMYVHEETAPIRSAIDKCLQTIGYTVVRHEDMFVAVPVSEMVFPNDVEEAK